MDFHKVLSFLLEYEWAYDFIMTEFLHLKMWQHMPEQWSEVLCSASIEDLNSVPYGDFKPEWPPSLRSFIQTAIALSIPRSLSSDIQPVELKTSLKKGVIPKKIHEISYMAKLVHNICTENNCCHILDIGSGLGYLGIVLTEHFGYHVVGVESKKSLSHGAGVHANSQGSKITSVEFELSDTQDSRVALLDLMKAHALKPDPVQWCMTGLHCCGDLTPTMLRMFAHTPLIQSIVVLSCCYHRMTHNSSCSYYQFPMSQKLKKAMSESRWKPSLFALRLAAQETRTRWHQQSATDHEYHQKNVAYRCLLEMADFQLEKKFRRFNRRSHFQTFDVFIENLLARTETTENVDKCRASLKQLHVEYEAFFQYIEPFTCIQVNLQPVLEALILHDRLEYLLEQPGIHAEIVPIFDENISPRNLALVAWKTSPS